MSEKIEETLTEQQLLEKIEHLREQLHRSVNADPNAFSDPKIQELSQHLDQLITRYTKHKTPR